MPQAVLETTSFSKEEIRMHRKISVETLERDAESLPSQEQLKLVEILIHKIRNAKLARKISLDWNKLYGLGKGLWKGEDAQAYIRRIREDRA
ncbi:MAG: hypothetical protein V1913_02615 [Fibrobacterota bacterium]